MNRAQTMLSRVVLLAVPFGAVALVAAPRDAAAQYIAPPPPPDAYVATAQPEYFEGRPVYYYNGNWYYRDERGAWGYYRSEPAYLRDRRAHWPAERHVDDHRYHYRR